MNSLEALADRCGIEKSFVDARGETQTATPATRRALLAAMGVAADSEDSARKALQELDREDWLQPLPPVQLIPEKKSVSVPFTAVAGTGTVKWKLTLENGESTSGEARFDSLPLLQRRELDGESRERRLLELNAANIPMGYHQLTLASGGAESLLIVTPERCWLPPAIEQGKRLWGVAAQLYLLRTKANWGIGDFTDLTQLVQMTANRGAQAIGLNPLHALFVDDPEHASPYSPASRLLLNVLNIDVMAVAEESGCTEALAQIDSVEFQQELAAGRESDNVDYTRVAGLKLPVLRRIFNSWQRQGNSAGWREFEAFRRAADESVQRSCLFLALRAHFCEQSSSTADWREWPAEFRSPDSAAVKKFSREEHDMVTFQMWLQFLADRQLAAAARAADAMAIGLYRDLAVGADPSGAETWSNQRAVITDAQVGAPPDIYNPTGQEWGLPPFHPLALKKEGYRSFIDLLRANMRRAGGLRIDHVMALRQLYWIPRGGTAAQGAYVRYPMEDLIGILALESHRNHCLVVGEDLGTVPPGFRERMTRARILSYRVLFFEQADGKFVAPYRYPELSLAVAGSHDLPTLSAWMAASDLALKEKLRLFPTEALSKGAHLDRIRDRQALLAAFRERGLAADPAMSMAQFADTAHAFLASTASAITMIQLDDVTHEATPVNVPTTSTEHPNWRRRLSLTLEEIAAEPTFLELTQRLNDTRGNVTPDWSNDPHLRRNEGFP
jgi:4-alpha-glucanotransferase